MGDSIGNDISILNASTGKGRFSINLGPTNGGTYRDPVAIATDPRTGTGYVVEGAASMVAVVNLSTGVVVNPGIPVGDAAQAAVIDPLNGELYVACGSTNNVSVINLTTNLPVRSIKVGAGPIAFLFDPINRLLYVANSEYSSISIVNTSTDKVVGTPLYLKTSTAPSTFPVALALDSKNGFIYVLNQNAGNVTIINGSNNRFVGFGIHFGGNPNDIAYDPVSGDIYIVGVGPGVLILNPRNTSLISPGLAVGASPVNVAVDQLDGRIFVLNQGSGNITVINATTNRASPPGWPFVSTFFKATFDPLNGLVYVATPDPNFACAGNGTVTILDPTAKGPGIGTMPAGLGPEDVLVDPQTGDLYVANFCSNDVSVLNTTTHTNVVPPIRVGAGPIGLGFNPLNGQVYVANGLSGSVTAIDGRTRTIVRSSIPVGANPEGIQTDWKTGEVFVSNFGSGNLSVFDGSKDVSLRISIPVGSGPQGVQYDPINDKIYVACSGSHSLSVVDPSTHRQTGFINTGQGPLSIALDGATNTLYVVDANSNGVTIVNATADSVIGGLVPANAGPQGTVFVPRTNQVYVTSFSGGTIAILGPVSPIHIDRLSSTLPIGEVGAPSVLSAAVSGATGTVTYSWSGLPTGCVSADRASLNCTPRVPGAVWLQVAVADAAGDSGWLALVWPIIAGLSVSEIVVTSLAIDLGQPLTLSTIVFGGLPPYTLAETGLPGGCPAPVHNVLTCTPTQTGRFILKLWATDSLGITNSTSQALQVNPELKLVGASAAPTTIVIGNTSVLNVTFSGGTPPVSVTYSGLPSGCPPTNASPLLCKPDRSGNYSIQVTVRDNSSESASAILVLKVLPHQNPMVRPPLRNHSGTPVRAPLLLIVGAVGSVAIVLAAVLLLRRRGRASR